MISEDGDAVEPDVEEATSPSKPDKANETKSSLKNTKSSLKSPKKSTAGSKLKKVKGSGEVSPEPGVKKAAAAAA